MNKMVVSNSPHITGNDTTRKIMLEVLIALVPALTAAVLFFGPKALAIAAICIAACMASEFLYNFVINCVNNKKFGIDLKKLGEDSALDGSAAVTGLLIALNMPVTVPLWVPVIGCVVAIVVVKMLFGGIGKNFANPALVARIFLFVSFMSLMVSAADTNNILGLEAQTSPTWLKSRLPGEVKTGWVDMLVGNTASAAMGETSIIAILIGGIYLAVRKIIHWQLPVMIIVCTAIFALLFDGIPNNDGTDILLVTLGHVMSGGLMLGAVFMATDYATSPNTKGGTIIYAVGIAFFIVILRLFSGYPEGVSFAIVIMNIVTPLLDKFMLPKPFAKPASAEPAGSGTKETAATKPSPPRDAFDDGKSGAASTPERLREKPSQGASRGKASDLKGRK